MKSSGAPSEGELVFHNYDQQRGIICVGIILETRGVECLVLWSNDTELETHPLFRTRPGITTNSIGWHKRTTLEVINGNWRLS